MEEAPWLDLHKGKSLTARGLARLLNPFGVISGSIRLDDGRTPKGYYRASFEDAWTRYCPGAGPRNATPPQANTGADFPDFSSRHASRSVADERRGIVSADGPGGGVADESHSSNVLAVRPDDHETEHQCGQCLKWRLSHLVDLDHEQRIYLCPDCLAEHER